MKSEEEKRRGSLALSAILNQDPIDFSSNDHASSVSPILSNSDNSTLKIISNHTKVKRKRISSAQCNRLLEVFDQTDTPSSEIRENLAEELNMSKREVQVWFQNRRAKMNRTNETTTRRKSSLAAPPQFYRVSFNRKPSLHTTNRKSGKRSQRRYKQPQSQPPMFQQPPPMSQPPPMLQQRPPMPQQRPPVSQQRPPMPQQRPPIHPQQEYHPQSSLPPYYSGSYPIAPMPMMKQHQQYQYPMHFPQGSPPPPTQQSNSDHHHPRQRNAIDLLASAAEYVSADQIRRESISH